MIHAMRHWISIMVLYAIALHLLWACLILFDPTTMDVTAVHALREWIPNRLALSGSIFFAATCAVIGLFTNRPWIVLLLIPQQLLLMASASGAIEAIWISQFSDGVARSQAFLAADQAYSILAAMGHTIAIAAHAQRVSRHES